MTLRQWLFATVTCTVLAGAPRAVRAETKPGTVAVLYFHNQGNPGLEPLKVGLSQMLITDLTTAASERWTVVERSQLQAILDELELGHSGMVDPDTAAQVGKLLGAEWMVMGSYFELLGTLRVDTRLVEVETGEIVYGKGVDGAAPEFRSMEASLAEGLSDALARAEGGDAEEAELPGSGAAAPVGTEDGSRASATTSTAGSGEAFVSGSSAATAVLEPDPEALEAAIAFSEGLILMDGNDTKRAREAFEHALAKDPALDAARTQLAALDL